MVIGNLDLASVTFAKLKTDSPTAVDGHGPLISAIAFQLVQADASRRTNITERLDDIQSQQQIDCSFKSEPAELVRAFAFPDLAGQGIAPRPDHGKNILRQTVNINHACAQSELPREKYKVAGPTGPAEGGLQLGL